VILWSHGQDASGRPNWQYGAPPVIRLFADAGWDVILVQRNERCQGRWTEKGGEYISHLVSQVRLAKQNGYRRVLVAGHSVGAGTALGAAGASSDIDGVLAFALSHGRSACRDPFTFKPQMIPFHEREIRNAIEKNRAPRLLICMGKDDHCVGHSFTPLVSSTLKASGRAYIHFDESMAIPGHGAANTRKFARLYGQCIREFFDRTDKPMPGRHLCAESE
jgi:dienelactone hydrolase